MKRNNSIYENRQFPKGRSYQIEFFNETETFPTHWHHYVEIIYATSDGTIYEVNEQQYSLKKGDILFIWPGELHGIIHMADPKRTLMLQVDAQLLTTRIDFQQWSYQYYKTRLLQETEEHAHIVRELHKILLEMCELSKQSDAFVEMKCCILFYNFIITMGQVLVHESSLNMQTPSSHKSKVAEQMLLACNYISFHCTEHLTLENVASVSGFSKFHFSKLFKQYTGLSFLQFQNKERLRIVETLLKTPELSITEISQEAGFDSIATFNRVFLQHKKVSPTQFRQMYQI